MKFWKNNCAILDLLSISKRLFLHSRWCNKRHKKLEQRVLSKKHLIINLSKVNTKKVWLVRTRLSNVWIANIAQMLHVSCSLHCYNLVFEHILQTLNNILEYFVKFKRTIQSCSALKISQSVNTHFFIGKPFFYLSLNFLNIMLDIRLRFS